LQQVSRRRAILTFGDFSMLDIKLFNYHAKEVRTIFLEGQIWFVAKDVCDVLELTNSRMAVAPLSEKMKRAVNFADSIGRMQEMTVISETALYKLVFRSNKPEAERFTDWVAEEVIPQIRKTGRYTPQHQGVLPLVAHTAIDVQKDMSKSINAHNYQNGGTQDVIAYNVANCVAHTGKTPSQLKREDQQAGLKSKDRSSGKAVVRATRPPVACCMSLADNLTEQGFNIHRVFEVSKTAEQLFTKMIALGAKPAELKD